MTIREQEKFKEELKALLSKYEATIQISHFPEEDSSKPCILVYETNLDNPQIVFRQSYISTEDL